MTVEKLLLVDDEEDIRAILELALRDKGYDVLVAENGQQALEVYLEHRPPVVITDIKMPGMDGIQLLEKIKQQDPDTEIIMITGHGDMDLAIRSFRKEAIEFITKPVSIQALDDALRKVWDKIRIRAQLRQYTQGLEAMVQEKSAKIKAIQSRVEKSYQARDLFAGERGFSELFDDLPFYVFILDPSLTVVAANRLFKGDFGDAAGSPCHGVCRQSAAPCKDCPVMQTFGDGQPRQGEMELINRQDRVFNVFYWTAPVRDAKERISHVMVMQTNITQVLRTQDHLSSLGLMVSTVSHGIKGLLTGLDGGVYLLESGLGKSDPDQATEGLAIVKRLIHQVRRMVLDILFYAKERELDIQSIDVSAFVDELSQALDGKMGEAGVTLETTIAPACTEFRTDAHYLHTALVNILENAADACRADTAKTTHQVLLDVSCTSDAIAFAVQDNGVGMSDATRKRIFTLFYSGKGHKGTGLGLFVANHIVHQLGGRIEVTSTLGQGTRVMIQLPHAAQG